MKYCQNCGTQMAEDAHWCSNCGTPAGGQPTGYGAPVFVNPYDHTSEFDAKDISENKVIAMLIYLLGAAGIIIALLSSQSSPYVSFHVRQGLKFTVVEVLAGIITALLCWTVIVPIVGGIFCIALLVVKLMMFFSICKGKAEEPAIIRSLNFLK